MDGIENRNKISRLMAARMLGEELSAEERRLFEEWLQESEEHRQVFERVKSLRATREILQLKTEHYGEKMAGQFRLRQQAAKLRRLRHRLILWGSGAAAVVLIALGIGRTGQSDRPQATAVIAEQQILPGKGKAVLTLASGQKIDVLRAKVEENVFIDAQGNEIIPEQPAEPEGESWSTLTVPAGGEFFYQLADGSKVWLNSDSELRFPNGFSARERRVYLRGEAFFDVVKDTEKPFIVALRQGDITVYGTRFCISDYAEAPLSAVLVKGSIGFTTTAGKSVRLSPADRLVCERETNRMTVTPVDTTLYTAWLHKMFIFKGQPLGEIMTTLARWYDVNVTFLSEDIKDVRLSGRLNRYQDVRILLHTYEETAGIRFQIDGKNIIVSKK